MPEEKKKQWLVTLPYDDVRGMEKRCELLSEIENDLNCLISHKFMNNNIKYCIADILKKINGKR